VIPIGRSSQRYCCLEKNDEPFRTAIRDIAQSRPRFGYKRILTILRRQGYDIGHKKMYRIYSEEGLQIRTRRRK
jgi:putative transposase